MEGASGVSKARTKRVNKVAMSVAAVGIATSVVGVAATQRASISAPLVDLAALIVVGSSTHPDGSGNEDFFQGMFNAPPYNTGDDLLHVNFFTGPFGVNQALQANAREDNAVLSSGWGAANDTPSPTSDPVATVDKPTNDESKTAESDTTAKKPEAKSLSAAEGDDS
jgi:hypothetical protein